MTEPGEVRKLGDVPSRQAPNIHESNLVDLGETAVDESAVETNPILPPCN